MVAIVGLGPIGLMLCACVADAGGRPVGVGSRAERRALASSFGAVAADPQGADVVIEAAGTVEAWERALGLVRPGGTVARVRRPAARRPGRGRRLSHPLRGGAPRRLVPPHAAALPGRARVSRERRVSVRAARHPRGRPRGCGSAVRRPAAGLPQGGRPAVTLSTRRLNRTLLARQLLLARARLPIGRALERVGGLAGAVRALAVRPALVDARRVLAGRSDPGAGATPSRPGDTDALDDPHRLAARLLALRGGNRPVPP